MILHSPLLDQLVKQCLLPVGPFLHFPRVLGKSVSDYGHYKGTSRVVLSQY